MWHSWWLVGPYRAVSVITGLTCNICVGCCSPEQVRDSPRTLSSERMKDPHSAAAPSRSLQPARMGECGGAAKPAEVQSSPQLVDLSPALSPHDRPEHCSTLGSSVLDGSISAGQSALVFAAETPVVPLRQAPGPAWEAVPSTPFFTPGVASTASVARQLQRERQDPLQPAAQPDPQHTKEGCLVAEATVATSAPLARCAAAESCTEVRAPATVDMSPQRAANLSLEDKASGGDAGE